MEAPERTLIVGRSPDADVTLADPSLAPRHAELVVTTTGRLHLTDCATATGTWLEGKGDWQRIRQAFPAGRVFAIMQPRKFFFVSSDISSADTSDSEVSSAFASVPSSVLTSSSDSVSKVSNSISACMIKTSNRLAIEIEGHFPAYIYYEAF